MGLEMVSAGDDAKAHCRPRTPFRSISGQSPAMAAARTGIVGFGPVRDHEDASDRGKKKTPPCGGVSCRHGEQSAETSAIDSNAAATLLVAERPK
jgi:hypothetical protein